MQLRRKGNKRNPKKTEHAFPAFLGTRVFLDVLSDWFQYLKIFLTQENVDKSHTLFCYRNSFRCPDVGSRLRFKMDPIEGFAPKSWKKKKKLGQARDS